MAFDFRTFCSLTWLRIRHILEKLQAVRAIGTGHGDYGTHLLDRFLSCTREYSPPTSTASRMIFSECARTSPANPFFKKTISPIDKLFHIPQQNVLLPEWSRVHFS